MVLVIFFQEPISGFSSFVENEPPPANMIENNLFQRIFVGLTAMAPLKGSHLHYVYNVTNSKGFNKVFAQREATVEVSESGMIIV